MTRAVYSLVLLSLLAVSVLLSNGCGGAADMARGYMKSGDRALESVRSGTDELAGKLESLFARYYRSLDAGGDVDASAFVAGALEIRRLAEGVRKKGDKALGQYSRILKLKGVEDYRRYAELQTGAIRMHADMLRYIDDVLEETSARISSGDFDPIDSASEFRTFFRRVKEMAASIDETQKKAEKVRRKENL